MGPLDIARHLADALASMRAWSRHRPAGSGALALLLLATSGAMLLVATRQRDIWWALTATVIGAAVGATGLLLVHELIAAWMVGRRRLELGALLGLGMVAAGAVITGVAIGGEVSALAALGMILLVLGLLPVNIRLGRASVAAPALWVLAGLAASVAAVVLIRVADGSEWPALPGVLCWLAGLVVFKLGFGPWLGRPSTRLRLATAVAAAATLAGAAALTTGADRSNELLLLAGLTLSVLGLSALGIAVPRHDIGKVLAGLMLVAGVAAVIAGGALVHAIVGVVGVALVASGVIAAMSAWFVFRGEGLVAAVLVGFVVVWVLVDRTVGVAADPWPDAAGRILALGDSYISGEGAPEYFEGTNVVGGDDPNQCRRAPSAYPYLVADRLGMGLDFLACSGAHTEQVDGGTDAGPAGPVAGHDDQLAHLSATRTPAQIEAIDVVLVSVGGNDVGFGTIVKACLLPASCDVLEQIWLANIETLGEELPATYQAIKEALPDTPIVVVPYPLILDEQTCGLAIDASEHGFVARFILALNAEVEAAASEAGVHVYPDAASAFEGHLLCDPDPATNFFQLSPTAGDFALRVLPSNWIHGSMHPGSSGHELLAAGLEPYIDDLLRRVAAGDPPNPVPVPGQDDAMSGEEAAEAEEAEELLSSDEWIQDQLYQTVGALVLPVGLLLMGGWVAAAGTVKQSWRLARFLSPPGSDTDQSNEGSETSETA